MAPVQQNLDHIGGFMADRVSTMLAYWEGTGLGLTIVKRYVELLRGTIHLKSMIGEGTTVTIELPKILI